MKFFEVPLLPKIEGVYVTVMKAHMPMALKLIFYVEKIFMFLSRTNYLKI